MKYNKVLTYKDTEEAKKLIGKKVIMGDIFKDLDETPEKYSLHFLRSVEIEYFPFVATDNTTMQFIREVIEEPTYRPFTCEEAKANIGRIVRRDRLINGDNCPQYNLLHSVVQETALRLSINGVVAEDFVKNWVFDDTNKPCGVEVENE